MQQQLGGAGKRAAAQNLHLRHSFCQRLAQSAAAADLTTHSASGQRHTSGWMMCSGWWMCGGRRERGKVRGRRRGKGIRERKMKKGKREDENGERRLQLRLFFGKVKNLVTEKSITKLVSISKLETDLLTDWQREEDDSY